MIVKDDVKGIEYTLEFNRNSVKYAESQGFDIGKAGQTDNLVTFVSDLFYYAFRMHHRDMTHADTDRLIDEMGGFTQAELEALVELYMKPINALISEDEDKSKNSKVAIVL